MNEGYEPNLGKSWSLLQAEADSEAQKAEAQQKIDFKDAFFVIVAWGNPYRSGSEYSWTGAFEDKKQARESGKRLESRGPKTFINWCGSSVHVIQGLETFMKKATKVGLNPAIKNLEWH